MKLQQATLITTFSEVLANLAFMFTAQENPDEAGSADWMEASIEYRGPCTGRLRLHCTHDFSRLLAANLLGLDPEEPEAAAKADDALKELMNVLCGQFVTSAYGSDGVFNLSIPLITAEAPAPDMSLENSACLASAFVDGHPVQVSHELN